MSAQQKLAFFKMHSLGNDFMVVDGVTQEFHPSAADISQWSNRNIGIGFDQLLIIEPPTEPHADFWYRIYNADGTSAEQCGNGTRCVAHLVKVLGLTPKSNLLWQSFAGDFQTSYTDIDHIQTQMTVPVLAEQNIPFDPSAAQPSTQQSANYTIQCAGNTYAITPVSMGNPHAVMFCDDIINVDVQAVGSALTDHQAFPAGANIGFCQVIDRHFIRLRVYERGTGETLACGTGACAAVVAARIHDLVEQRVKVSLPGGKLRIAWPGADSPVTMTGNATLAYQGELTMEQ